MITGLQIRAARSALRWTIAELAKRSGVAVRTIKRFEQNDDVPPSRSATLISIRTAFEKAGIEFVGINTNRLGIILVKNHD
jgi:transcriptional regulator with XRE-family HTH domain